MSSLQRSIGGTTVAAIPLQCFFLLCFFHGSHPTWKDVYPRNFLRDGKSLHPFNISSAH